MKDQALKIVHQAIVIAQSKGVYTLEDSEQIIHALRILAAPEPTPTEEGKVEKPKSIKK